MAKQFSLPHGVSPALATAVADFLKAERLWSKATLAHGEGSAEEKAAWSTVSKTEGAISRTRCRTLADLGAKLRLDAYLGGVGCGSVSSLYASVLRDAQPSRAKGGAA